MDLLSKKVAAVTWNVDTSVSQVWSVLDDGWLFPLWVVGASRMRNVDPGWPAIGTKLHHSVGGWPLLLDDETEVLNVVPGEFLHLKAHSWPAGAAEVLLTTESIGTQTKVTIREDASDGPGTLVPQALRQLSIVPRNREAMKRLAFIAEGR